MNSWWVDTDPGVDDAWALLMMLHSDAVRVEGISVVGGNVGLVHTLANACRIVDRSPYSMPVTRADRAQSRLAAFPWRHARGALILGANPCYAFGLAAYVPPGEAYP